jgi:prophage regulatory protein
MSTGRKAPERGSERVGEDLAPELGERLLRLKDVQQKVGLGSSTIYRKIAAGTFPRPLSLGEGTVRWRLSEIDAWIGDLQPSKSAGEAA